MRAMKTHRLNSQCGNSISNRPAAKQAAEKGPHSFCHSERSEESLFLFMGLYRREIPRFARNEKINYFFRSLKSACAITPQRLKMEAIACPRLICHSLQPGRERSGRVEAIWPAFWYERISGSPLVRRQDVRKGKHPFQLAR